MTDTSKTAKVIKGDITIDAEPRGQGGGALFMPMHK